MPNIELFNSYLKTELDVYASSPWDAQRLLYEKSSTKIKNHHTSSHFHHVIMQHISHHSHA
jgi:hypothetical protein